MIIYLQRLHVDVLAERHSSWESEEVLLNALAAINNITYYATGDGLWSRQAERLGEGEWAVLG